MSDLTPRAARLWRVVAGVIAGYALFAVAVLLLFALTRSDPYAVPTIPFLVASTLYGMAAAGAGGCLAVLIEGRMACRSPIALMVVIALAAVASLLTAPDSSGHWSQFAALLLMAPSAYVAGNTLAVIRRPPDA